MFSVSKKNCVIASSAPAVELAGRLANSTFLRLIRGFGVRFGVGTDAQGDLRYCEAASITDTYLQSRPAWG